MDGQNGENWTVSATTHFDVYGPSTLRMVRIQAILFLESMSDPPLSDMDFKNERA